MSSALANLDFAGHCEYCNRLTPHKDSEGDWCCANGTGCALPLPVVRRAANDDPKHPEGYPNLRMGRPPGRANSPPIKIINEELTLAQWARKFGIRAQNLLAHQKRHGWTIERELLYRIRRGARKPRANAQTVVCIDGESLTLEQWAERLETNEYLIRVGASHNNRPLREELLARLRKQAKKQQKAKTRS